MLSSPSRTPALARVDINSYAVQRRQVRKGTFSCWECKRRKTRCEYKHKSSPICVSCQRRGTSCVRQELADPAENSDVGVEERIDRVESLVSQLVQQRSIQPTGPRGRDVTSNENENDDSRGAVSVPTADLSADDSINSPVPSLLATTPKLVPGSRSLSSHLHALLPHPTKAALILNQGKFSNLPIHTRGQPSKKITPSLMSAEQLAQVAELPPPTAHPVHFARKLIQLALCLQQLEKPVYDAARRYVDIASRYVTSQDSLMESIDGIETLMLESCYYINVGDIRGAWLVVRRAVSIAQLIGLPMQTREADCREENAWFRLVFGDRCLSWMLGLPMAVIDNTFASEHELVADAWSAKLERIHAVIFGRIISRNLCMQRYRRQLEQRNNDLYDDCKETQDIDRELKQAARSLPTKWWLCPTLEGSMHAEIMNNTKKIVAQMHHYFLLVVLYQPYLVCKSHRLPLTGGGLSARSPFDNAYSQIAVLSASREILSRFLVLRRVHRTLSYRGVDDKVFIVCMMFLLIHINGHSLGCANVLEHQRPHDLGVINEGISIIEETSSANKDTLSSSMVPVLKRLLDIEAQSAEGRRYFIWMEEIPKTEKNDDITDDNDDVSLPMPYFGSIRIARQKPSKVCQAADLGFGSIYSPELQPAISAGTEYDAIRNTLGDRDLTDMTTAFILSNGGIDYDENLDFQLSKEPNVENVPQSPSHILQEISSLNQPVYQQHHPRQDVHTPLLSPWLNGEPLAEVNQMDAEIWPIES